MKNVILLIVLSLSFRVAIARKPAVEPVRGLSIDHFEKIEKTKAKGFDWNNSKKETVQKTTKNNAPIRIPNSQTTKRVEMKTTTESSFPVALVFILVLLPVGILIAVNKLKTDEFAATLETTEEEIPQNVHALPTRNKNSDDDDGGPEENLPKAS